MMKRNLIIAETFDCHKKYRIFTTHHLRVQTLQNSKLSYFCRIWHTELSRKQSATCLKCIRIYTNYRFKPIYKQIFLLSLSLSRVSLPIFMTLVSHTISQPQLQTAAIPTNWRISICFIQARSGYLVYYKKKSIQSQHQQKTL